MALSADPSSVSNRLLASLPPEDFRRLMSHAQEMKLEVGDVLYESRQPIENIYFMLSGMASIVTQMMDGSSVEVLVVGREGIVGIPALQSAAYTVPTRAFIQIAGHGIKINASVVRNEFQRKQSLRDVVMAYYQFIFVQLSQCGACNRLHDLEERLARWLLMVADRMDSNEFLLTQEFLGNMLGTRRSSVTLAAGTLQRGGFIQYGYGRINILNRAGLENVSCECYSLIREAWDTFHAVTKAAH